MIAIKTDFTIKPKAGSGVTIYRGGKWAAWAANVEAALQRVWQLNGSVPGAYWLQ